MSIKIWEGPSEITGDEIMLYLSGEDNPSKNKKTGPMLQVGVMVKDVKPFAAAWEGKDEAICGGCNLRPIIHKAAREAGEATTKHPCYVVLFRMYALWRKVKGLLPMPTVTRETIASHWSPSRFGSYGNGSSVPRDVLEPQLEAAQENKGHTLYEHEWPKKGSQWLRKYAMASVETLEQKRKAKALGWRTFRQIEEGGKLEPDEVMCPYVTHGVQCADCLLCCGLSKKAKSVATPSHK